ncbi:MAG: hypothetical protein AAGF67_01220 [Verrucomicrobiota bacterium]
MKTSAPSTIILLIFSVLLFEQSSFAEKASSTPLPPDVIEAVEALCDGYAARILPALSTIDTDQDGKVSLKQFVSEMMSRGFAKKPDLTGVEVEEKDSLERTHRWKSDMDRKIAASLGTDDEGFITEAGISAAMQDLVLYRLNRMGPLDVNEDGRLSLAEYALGFPARPDQERDEDGFTDYQKSFFERRDVDQNGFLQGEEYLGSTDRYVTSQVDELIVGILLPRADLNQDGKITPLEMESVTGTSRKERKSIELSESIFWLRTVDESEIALMAEQLSESLKGT